MKFNAGKSTFVSMRDLVFIGNLPNYIISEMKVNSEFKNFEEFRETDSIIYFDNRKEIIDYDEIRNLSEEAIYDLIHSFYEEYFRLLKNYKSVDVQRKMEICEHKVYELKDYLDYKNVYDKKYKKIKIIKNLKEN